MQLGRLAAQEGLAVAQDLRHVRERRDYPHGRLVEDQRLADAHQLLEGLSARRHLGGKEAQEEEPIGGEAGHGQRGDGGAGPRHGDDRDAFRAGVAHQPVARVGHGRSPRVGDEGHVAAGAQGREDLPALPALVVLEVRRDRRRDAVGAEQHGRAARVLAGDERHLAQDADGPQRDVLEVPQRGGHDVQRPRRAFAHARASVSPWSADAEREGRLAASWPTRPLAVWVLPLEAWFQGPILGGRVARRRRGAAAGVARGYARRPPPRLARIADRGPPLRAAPSPACWSWPPSSACPRSCPGQPRLLGQRGGGDHRTGAAERDTSRRRSTRPASPTRVRSSPT